MSSVAKEIKKDDRAGYVIPGKMARGANAALSLIAVFIVIVILVYSIYSLLYTYQIYNDSYLDSEIIDLHPTFSGGDTDNRLTFRELLAINEDTTSWVTIDGTKIDYPVMQGEDDYEYVNKNVYGDFELSGSIFLSARNAKDYSDPYNLLFGHHIYNGGMFGDVMKYKDADFFKENTTGILYLPDATYSIKLYACVECSAYDENIFYAAKEMEEMGDFQKWVRENATHYRDIGITADDKIIALTTCENATTDGRCAVVGRLDRIAMVEQGFDEETDQSKTDTAEGLAKKDSKKLSWKYFFRKPDTYYYLIIIFVFLLSLLTIGLMQKDEALNLDITDEDKQTVENKLAKKRRKIHRILCTVSIVVGAGCVYLGQSIYEEICAIVSISTISFLGLAEYIRQKKS